VPRRPRTQFAFNGALDEIPPATVATMARVTAVLLGHGDEHVGLPARIRIARDANGLNLWLNDPECSSTCLDHAGDLDTICDPRDPALDGVRVSAEDRIGGLHLHWLIQLAPAAPSAGTSV
jgi:hypothetical protein